MKPKLFGSGSFKIITEQSGEHISNFIAGSEPKELIDFCLNCKRPKCKTGFCLDYKRKKQEIEDRKKNSNV